MSKSSIGVAVIGAGMAGRAHASGYRSAPAVFGTDLPDVRLVAIADAHEPFAVDTARRYGYQRAETSWQAIADGARHRRGQRGGGATRCTARSSRRLLDAGKHVLCEKPLAPSRGRRRRPWWTGPAKSDRVAAVGFTFRRSPAINAIREQITGGSLGPAVHFSGHYWCDYGFNPDAPISWRYQGGPGSGALADIGTHLVDVGEFLCGPVQSVRGAVLTTTIPDRPVPLGTAVGHAAGVPVSDVREPVENEDIATFTATFASGADRHVLGVQGRLRPGRTRSASRCSADGGAAAFDLGPGGGVHDRRPARPPGR